MKDNIIQALKNMIADEREHMRRCDKAALEFHAMGDKAKEQAMLAALERHFAVVVWCLEKLEAAE